MLQIGQFAGGGDTQSSGFIAAYDLATGNFDGPLGDASGNLPSLMLQIGQFAGVLVGREAGGANTVTFNIKVAK